MLLDSKLPESWEARDGREIPKDISSEAAFARDCEIAEIRETFQGGNVVVERGRREFDGEFFQRKSQISLGVEENRQ